MTDREFTPPDERLSPDLEVVSAQRKDLTDDDLKIRLIGLVEERPVIWKVQSDDLKLKDERIKALADIASVLNSEFCVHYDGSTVAKEFKKLKYSYGRAKAAGKTGEGADDAKRRKNAFRYTAEMTFLQQNDHAMDKQRVVVGTGDEELLYEAQAMSSCSADESDVAASQKKTTTPISRTPRKRRRRESDIEDIDKAMLETVQNLTGKLTSEQKTAETLVGETIASTLLEVGKKNPSLALRMKRELFELCFKFEEELLLLYKSSIPFDIETTFSGSLPTVPCIGGVDGKYFAINAPTGEGSVYYNHKLFHSIIGLAWVDANYKLIFFDVGSPGRCSDAGVYKSSPVAAKVRSGQAGIPNDRRLGNYDLPFVFVTDQGFKLSKHVLRPFSQRDALRDKVKNEFNYRLSRARRVTENCFCILISVRGRRKAFLPIFNIFTVTASSPGLLPELRTFF
ncbi:hypothetical protein QR680_014384 [Steinernema hermaphroditum]|uniref:MADF domain-containing protein n=1 Tax=Steinernema hermaphroditum TaxID=289476 RepID=A0AA39M3U0_9BILA|nr:hypothetical protein QR680_014384 [Steinernema hermaphroditum]